MKGTLVIIFLIWFVGGCDSKKSLVDLPANQSNGIIKSTITEDDENIYVILKNVSSSDQFVLSSYLNNRFTYNKNFYRRSDDILMISFLPIIEHLGTIKSDVLVIDETSIYKNKQAIFEFLEIPVGETLEIELDKKTLKNKFEYMDNSKLQIKLAIYDKVDYLIIKGIEYDDRTRDLFLDQASQFWILDSKNF